MLLTTENPTGSVGTLDLETVQQSAMDSVESANRDDTPTSVMRVRRAWEQGGDRPASDVQPILALFCYEEPGSDVPSFINEFAGPLARRGIALHVFARKAFELDAPGTLIHVLGDGGEGSLLERVTEFTHRACNAFLKQFQGSADPITLMGCEWSAIPALSLLRGIKNHGYLLSLHSVERQRSDLSSEVSKRIEEIEFSGLREARLIMTHSESTSGILRDWAPDFSGRYVAARPMFPIQEFATPIDPGIVKARYQIGPVDPMIVYVGDLEERYGPDMLLKAMPNVLKNHPQARLVVVGEGSQYWPLRVYSRYLLLDHAVRMAGHVEGAALCELAQAADVMVVPSRDSTPWWPIQAGWAARRPVVATLESAPELLIHEHDSLLIHPEQSSCASGIDRILSDRPLAESIARRGQRKIKERFGWDAIASQVAEAMGVLTKR